MDSLKFFAIIFVLFPISGIQSQMYKSPNGVTYYVNSTASLTWYEAYIECSSRGLMLLTFDSKEKLADFYAISGLSTTTPFWTGLIGRYKKFAWILTGKPSIPSLWCTTQPGGAGNCVQVFTNCLTDKDCSAKIGFVCEERVQQGGCCETESEVLNFMQNNTCKNV